MEYARGISVVLDVSTAGQYIKCWCRLAQPILYVKFGIQLADPLLHLGNLIA